MDILLTGTEEWAIDTVARSLRADGHQVLSCFDDPTSDAPCNALTGCGQCPGSLPVAVVVAVRAHPLPNLTRREHSVACPMLGHVPLVVAGATVLNPFGPRATRVVEGLDVEGAVRDAASTGRAERALL